MTHRSALFSLVMFRLFIGRINAGMNIPGLYMNYRFLCFFRFFFYRVKCSGWWTIISIDPAAHTIYTSLLCYCPTLHDSYHNPLYRATSLYLTTFRICSTIWTYPLKYFFLFLWKLPSFSIYIIHGPHLKSLCISCEITPEYRRVEQSIKDECQNILWGNN